MSSFFEVEVKNEYEIFVRASVVRLYKDSVLLKFSGQKKKIWKPLDDVYRPMKEAEEFYENDLVFVLTRPSKDEPFGWYPATAIYKEIWRTHSFGSLNRKYNNDYWTEPDCAIVDVRFSSSRSRQLVVSRYTVRQMPSEERRRKITDSRVWKYFLWQFGTEKSTRHPPGRKRQRPLVKTVLKATTRVDHLGSLTHIRYLWNDIELQDSDGDDGMLSTLPNDILAKVLTYLEAPQQACMSRICRRFRCLTLSSSVRSKAILRVHDVLKDTVQALHNYVHIHTKKLILVSDEAGRGCIPVDSIAQYLAFRKIRLEVLVLANGIVKVLGGLIVDPGISIPVASVTQTVGFDNTQLQLRIDGTYGNLVLNSTLCKEAFHLTAGNKALDEIWQKFNGGLPDIPADEEEKLSSAIIHGRPDLDTQTIALDCLKLTEPSIHQQQEIQDIRQYNVMNLGKCSIRILQYLMMSYRNRLMFN